MARRRRRDFSNISADTVREQAAMLALRNAHRKGHVYVKLGQAGKRYVFLCILCLAPCYSEKCLNDHLRGKHHMKKLVAAQATLLKPNPWPFDDGVFFFHGSDHYGGNVDGNADGGGNELVIPGVLRGDQMDSLKVKLFGFGEIGARILEPRQDPEEMNRIWCAWVGKRDANNNDDHVFFIPRYDFGVVTFSYDYNLGRNPVVRDLDQLLQVVNDQRQNKRRKSVSDPGDSSKSLSAQGDPSVEDYDSADSTMSARQQLRLSKSTMRLLRQEMREQERVASERTCYICHNKLCRGMDVSSLLNMKTGRLVCSSRNATGAFHLFHVSCLVHWILLCEYEIRTNRQQAPRQSKRKSGARRSAKKMDDKRVTMKQISSAFCPECQGTGINVVDNQLEKPSFLLTQMIMYMIKAKGAHKAYMKAPEDLERCSMGLHFPSQLTGPVQEMVARLKLLHFYRADT